MGGSPPPLHPRLRHFSEAQVKEVVDRYYSRDGSVRALMDEFEISGKPGSFVSILPPIIHDDVKCPYCVGQSLVSGRQSRDTTQSPIPFCRVCGHQDDARCACKTCKATAFEKAKQIAEQKRDVIRGRFAFPSSPDLDIENLSFRNAIFLLCNCDDGGPGTCVHLLSRNRWCVARKHAGSSGDHQGSLCCTGHRLISN